MAGKATFKDVMQALYEDGDKGTSSVAPAQLEAKGFSKKEVLEAAEQGIQCGYVRETGSNINRLLWCLTPKGRYYVESLLEE